MSGRRLAWALAALALLALAAQTARWRDRLTASRLLRRVEVATAAAVARGAVPRPLLAHHVEILERAGRLDPREVGVPIALGSQHLLAGRAAAAVAAYEAALALEPRPEIHLNLARAHALAGRQREAERYLELAIRLDPRLALRGGSE